LIVFASRILGLNAAKEKLVPILYEQSGFTKSMILDGKAIGKIVIGAAPRLRRGFGAGAAFPDFRLPVRRPTASVLAQAGTQTGGGTSSSATAVGTKTVRAILRILDTLGRRG